MILLNDRVKRNVKTAFTYGIAFQALPFKWDNINNCPVEVVGWKKRLCLFHFVIAAIYNIFILLQYIHIEVTSTKGQEWKKIYMRFVLSFFTFSNIVRVNVYWKEKEFIAFARRFCRYFDDFEEKFIKRNVKKPMVLRLLPFIQEGMKFGFYQNIALIVLAAVVRPDLPGFLTSVVEEGQILEVWQIALSAAFEGYVCHNFLAMSVLVEFTIFAFMIPLLTVMKELNHNSKKMTYETLRNPYELIKAYRCLQRLVALMNSATVLIVPSFKLSMGLIAVFCLYGAVRLSGPITIVLSVFGSSCTMLLALTFGFFAEIHSKSVELLQVWQHQIPKYYEVRSVDWAWSRRSLRTLKVLSVNVANFYFVDKAMIFTMFEIIFENAINFLLMNP